MAKLKIKLDFKKFFIKESKNLIKYYKLFMKKKQGLNYDDAPSNKPSTVKKKGKDHWLVDTGETMQKGFKYRAKRLGMLVFASGQKHSGRSTYIKRKDGKPAGKKINKSKNPPRLRQIFEWHNKKNYSGVFGELPKGSAMHARFDKEANKQVQVAIEKAMRDSVKGIKGVKFI